jgi:hypothetical protein
MACAFILIDIDLRATIVILPESSYQYSRALSAHGYIFHGNLPSPAARKSGGRGGDEAGFSVFPGLKIRGY